MRYHHVRQTESIPVNKAAIFNMGSISKMYVAAAIMLLVDELKNIHANPRLFHRHCGMQTPESFRSRPGRREPQLSVFSRPGPLAVYLSSIGNAKDVPPAATISTICSSSSSWI